jgi:ribonuclease HI
MYEKPTKGWVIDGATEGNPGMSEYRCVDLVTGEILFHKKIGVATNNICEFIGLVHAFSLALKENIKTEIYTDSVTALTWFKNKKCNSSLQQGRYTMEAIELQKRAENFLSSIDLDLSEFNVIKHNGIEILKWFTQSWGESPADFGRKNIYKKY